MSLRCFWYIVAAVALFLSGVFFALVFRSGFKYTSDITLADIINIFATCVVTIFAAWYISKKLNEDRYAKELAIDDLREIESRISAIVMMAQNVNDGNIQDIVASVHLLHGLLNRLGRMCSINGEAVSIEKIKNRFYCFYGCTTNFGYNKTDMSIDMSLVVTTGDDLIVEIRDTILKINRL